MFYRDNAALLCLFSHVSSCFHDRPSDNPHMLHSNKTSQFLPLASLPWQPDSFLEPTFLLAYLTQSRGRRPKAEKCDNEINPKWSIRGYSPIECLEPFHKPTPKGSPPQVSNSSSKSSQKLLSTSCEEECEKRSSFS